VRRILVALDGSRLAESVLEPARSLAQHFDARLVVVHVVEREPPSDVHGEPHLGTASAARRYLDELATRLEAAGVAVEPDVREPPADDVAEALDEAVRDLRADLVAMCVHGRSNVRDRLLGSIAERTVRCAAVPVFLQTVPELREASFDIRHVLVALDFGHDVEAALEAARTFAAPYGAAVTLMSVPEPTRGPAPRLLPRTTALAYRFEREELLPRLTALADRLRRDVPDVTSTVLEQRPADAILAISDSLPADLIIVITDAHTGLSAWYEPSTTRRLLGRGGLTILLIREGM